ncbi:MAG TPA: hypothetical protein VLT58_01810, partial [Polyangia bacterium]|nr:hypothetical protein [Polyangia bacterium]
MTTSSVSAIGLLEVAVALPVSGTFTYRDPRAQTAPVGAQVVVPFGSRTVTGFVVGHAPAAPDGEPPRAIEAVVGGEPAFDEAMIAFCRWTADYYQAPLGEVLRAALPQGEQSTAKRAVRLTDQGRQELERQAAVKTLLDDAPRDPILAALADAGGELPLQRLLDVLPNSRGGSRAILARHEASGLVEVGDALTRRRPPPTVVLAFAASADPGAALPKRAGARRAVLAKIA